LKSDAQKAAERAQKAADEAQKTSVEAQKLADEAITSLKFDFNLSTALDYLSTVVFWYEISQNIS
jgi:GTP cyclohydrolase III